MAKTGSLSGLANILSAEKMPRRPEVRGPEPIVEIENWVVRLENYLRRLFGKFTAENIISTIINEGDIIFGDFDLVYDKWIHVPKTTLAGATRDLIAEDVRGRTVLVSGVATDDVLYNDGIWDSMSAFPYFAKSGSNYAVDYTLVSGASGSWSWSIYISGTNGHLVLSMDAVDPAFDLEIRVNAFLTVRKTAKDEDF